MKLIIKVYLFICIFKTSNRIKSSEETGWNEARKKHNVEHRMGWQIYQLLKRGKLINKGNK